MEEVLPTLRKTGEYKMPEPDPKPYEYFDKTFNGEPIVSTADVEYFTKIKRHTIDWYLMNKLVEGKDFYLVKGDTLEKFKSENPKISHLVSAMYLVTREGFIRFCGVYGIKVETPKCFESNTEAKPNKPEKVYALIPDDREIQKILPKIKHELVLISGLLEKVSMYNYELDQAVGLCKAVEGMGVELSCQLCDLRRLVQKVQTTSMYKLN